MTIYSGAAPDEIETLITDKIEGKLEDLEDVRSYIIFIIWCFVCLD